MNQDDQQFILQNVAAILRDNLGQRVNDTLAHGLIVQLTNITATRMPNETAPNVAPTQE